MERDISSRDDIILLVDTFYEKVLKDEVISEFFTKVVPIDFNKHMPTMYDFWEMVLLNKMVYKGNPMLKHISIDKKSKLEEKHFDRWLLLFNETIDKLFIGPKVELAKQRALSMKALMLHKIDLSRGDHFIQ